MDTENNGTFLTAQPIGDYPDWTYRPYGIPNKNPYNPYYPGTYWPYVPTKASDTFTLDFTPKKEPAEAGLYVDADLPVAEIYVSNLDNPMIFKNVKKMEFLEEYVKVTYFCNDRKCEMSIPLSTVMSVNKVMKNAKK